MIHPRTSQEQPRLAGQHTNARILPHGASACGKFPAHPSSAKQRCCPSILHSQRARLPTPQARGRIVYLRLGELAHRVARLRVEAGRHLQDEEGHHEHRNHNGVRHGPLVFHIQQVQAPEALNWRGRVNAGGRHFRGRCGWPLVRIQRVTCASFWAKRGPGLSSLLTVVVIRYFGRFGSCNLRAVSCERPLVQFCAIRV